MVTKSRFLLAFWMLLSVAACGFEPVYQQRAQQLDLIETLAMVDIAAPASLEGDRLKAALEDLFRRGPAMTAPRYQLRTDLQTEEKAFIIDEDGLSSRYDVILTSNYTLLRLSDQKILDQGQIKRYVSYNLSDDNDYATYISQKDAIKRGISMIAQDYQQRLAARLFRAMGRP